MTTGAGSRIKLTLGQCREEHACKNRNDRNDHEQFDGSMSVKPLPAKDLPEDHVFGCVFMHE